MLVVFIYGQTPELGGAIAMHLNVLRNLSKFWCIYIMLFSGNLSYNFLFSMCFAFSDTVGLEYLHCFYENVEYDTKNPCMPFFISWFRGMLMSSNFI